jgi:hypothetical protein
MDVCRWQQRYGMHARGNDHQPPSVLDVVPYTPSGLVEQHSWALNARSAQYKGKESTAAITEIRHRNHAFHDIADLNTRRFAMG